MVKAITYYLPQYHEIPENNEWWGSGFTEWTNLKKAKPLYKGHEIKYPLNENFYNLLDKNTVIWQTDLANKYGIYAFNYYHYWFKGKKILEKPAENLLKWKDINQKFMFMWANHDWTRSWVGGKEVLLKMDYGTKEDWISHFNYLIDFFKDERYIKLNNRPVFQIYITKDIPSLKEMVDLWNELCIENGFDGIYIIDNVDYHQIIKNEISDVVNAVSIEEQTTALQYWRKNNPISLMCNKMLDLLQPNKIKQINYDLVVRNSVEYMLKSNIGKKTFFGVCTGWDNTSRYGKKGYVITNSTPIKFKKYLEKAFQLSLERKQEFIFISCWNEWCEGMCLEPNNVDEYGYLEAVSSVFNNNNIL
jgi:hypothetical protein